MPGTELYKGGAALCFLLCSLRFHGTVNSARCVKYSFLCAVPHSVLLGGFLPRAGREQGGFRLTCFPGWLSGTFLLAPVHIVEAAFVQLWH